MATTNNADARGARGQRRKAAQHEEVVTFGVHFQEGHGSWVGWTCHQNGIGIVAGEVDA